MDNYDILIITLKNLIRKIIINNIKDTIKENDNINIILNSLFPKTIDEKEIIIQLAFIFLIFYTEFINQNLEEETKKIYLYIKKPNIKYKINYNIFDSVYVIIVSLIEACLNDGCIIKKFDIILTKNINRIQKHEQINYDPQKTPVIKELLYILTPILDELDFYNFINDFI